MATFLGERPGSPKAKMDENDFLVGSRTYEREFLVLADSKYESPIEIQRCLGVPRMFDPFVFGGTNDAYALVRAVDAERLHPGSIHWVVKVSYRTFNRSEILLQYEDPLLQPPEIDVTYEVYQEPAYDIAAAEPAPGVPPNTSPGDLYDADGNPIELPEEVKVNVAKLGDVCRNSAGQIYDPPPMRDRSRLILTISRNEPMGTNHPGDDIKYLDRVNSDTFWRSPPGTWKCMGIATKREVKIMQDTSLRFYLRCIYKFAARPTWDAKILDAGSYYLVEKPIPLVGFNKVNFQVNGHATSGNLNGTGGILADDAAPVWKLFKIYDRVPFAPMNLPQNFIGAPEDFRAP